jgi:hypothetical protein
MRRTLRTWMLASTFGVGACSFQSNGVTGDGAPGVDGNRDGAPSDGRPTDGGPCGGAALTFSPRHFDKCAVSAMKLSTLGGNAITINTTNKTINRGNGPELLPQATVVAQAGGPEILLVASTNLTITATQVVTVVGARSIVFVDTATLTVDGRIIAAADSEIGGAGAHAASCGSIGNSGDGVFTVLAGVGAGGGGFGEPMFDPDTERSGARGGGSLGAFGGKFFAASASLAKLRGGCAGGTGLFTKKGAGGGAIGLVANTVQVNSDGVLAVPGSGGGAAAFDTTGGGGGGSGGAIWIEGASVRVSGTCTANGGGGGAGHKNSVGGAGANGALDNDNAANGGSAQSGGPDGGKGAAGTNVAEAGDNPGPGDTAGGGGGGPGVIRVKSHIGTPSIGGALFSPPLTPTQ